MHRFADAPKTRSNQAERRLGKAVTWWAWEDLNLQPLPYQPNSRGFDVQQLVRELVSSSAHVYRCPPQQDPGDQVHHLRHTTASLLKKLAVAPRDAQIILGHAHVSTTMQIYTHVDEEARKQALAGLNDLLSTDS